MAICNCCLLCFRLRLVFNWIIYAFAGYLETEQVRNENSVFVVAVFSVIVVVVVVVVVLVVDEVLLLLCLLVVIEAHNGL